MKKLKREKHVADITKKIISMRIVFMGTADFITSLERMVEAELNIVAVYTQPPRPFGTEASYEPSWNFCSKKQNEIIDAFKFLNR